MKKWFLILKFFLLCITLCAQEHIELSYQNGGLHSMSDKAKLDDETLRQLLSANDYDTYKVARNCYVASIPLWTLSACAGATGVGIIVTSLIADSHHVSNPETPTGPAGPIFRGLIGYPLLGASLIPLIPAVALTVSSHKKMNLVVRNHNLQLSDYSRCSFQMMNRPGQIGICLKF